MRILMCVDGSRVNRDAVSFGSLIASAMEAEVTLLHVAENEDNSKEIFAKAKEILKKDHVEKIRTKKLKGRPDTKIIRHANKEEYDLVIMGSHGVRYTKVFLFGDVAFKVIEHVKSPVLVVRAKKRRLKKILFCTGGSELAEKAVEFGSEIAKKMNARASVLHVMPQIPAMYRGFGMAENIEHFLQSDTLESKAVKNAAQILEDKGIETKVRLSHGMPPEEILSISEEEEYDLIIMGSKGMTSPSRFLLGDVAYRVVRHTQTPILLVK